MGFNTAKKVQEGGMILGGLGVIGFIGIIWLMIYGNLSGNLGFTQQDSSSYVNQTINLTDAGATPSGAQNRVHGAISNVIMTNASADATVVTTANYSLSGVLFTPDTVDYNATEVNVSYSVSYDGIAELRAEGVISNISGGFGTFFGFSGTFFTIAAIVLLIFMLIGLLALVVSIVKMQSGKKSGGFD